jgi:hypothetical protein
MCNSVKLTVQSADLSQILRHFTADSALMTAPVVAPHECQYRDSPMVSALDLRPGDPGSNLGPGKQTTS